ncbi:restriction endonuclease subunit S [Microcoleus sp. FACHB-53]|nr:restriction endonuclease subunit S [Microcoleus sp. FACHB-53]
MSKHWSLVRLDKILQLQRRWLKLDPTETYAEIGIRSFGKGIFHKTPVVGASLGNKRVLQIQPGDIVFNNVFAWEGAVAVASEAEAGMIGSHRFVTYTPIGNQCSVEYLRLFFRSQSGLEVLRRVSPGSAGRNRTLNIAQFAKQEIPLPPLEEQLRIVAQVEEVAGKIEEARRLRKRAEEEAATLLVQNIGHIFKAAASQGKFQIRLGEICDFQGGSQPPKMNFSYEEIPDYVRLIQIRDYKSDDYITYVHKNSVRRFCNAEDVMIGRYGPPVFQILRGIEGAYNVALMKAVPDERKLSKNFLFYLLQEPILHKKVVDDSQRTSGQTGVRKELLKKHVTFVPPIPEQHRIAAFLDNLQAKVNEMHTLRADAIEKVDALLPSILDKALKGEL